MGNGCRGVARPRCTRLGRRFVSGISEDNDHLVVHIRSVKSPLYWPKEYPLFDLYKVITEAFCEDDWHFYEVPETRVEPGDVVLDCGAAEGIFALRVQDRAARIVAFEPLPRFVASMRRTFAGDPNVSVVPQALGAAEGTAVLAGDSLYGCVVDQGQGTPIRITTIDRSAQESARGSISSKAISNRSKWTSYEAPRIRSGSIGPRLRLRCTIRATTGRRCCPTFGVLCPAISTELRESPTTERRPGR